MMTNRLNIAFVCLVNISIYGGAETKKISPEAIKYLPLAHNGIFLKTIASLEVNNENQLYITDNREHVINKIDEDGRLIKRIGQEGQGPGDLLFPIETFYHEKKLVVRDNNGISSFDDEGMFITRFRVFSQINSFAGNRSSVFVVHPDSEKMIAAYDYEGKKENQFGHRYDIPYSKYRKFPYPRTLSWMFHQGKLLCGKDNVYFVSSLFGDIFKYDLEGKLLDKKEFSNDGYVIAKKKEFFEIGWDSGAKVGIEPRFVLDAKCDHGRIYLLRQAVEKNAFSVYVVEEKNLKILDIIKLEIAEEEIKSNIFSKLGIFNTEKSLNVYVSFLGEKSGDIYVGKFVNLK